MVKKGILDNCGKENLDIRWLYHDAMKCYEYGMKPAGLLLLLCAVDALAAKEYPMAGVRSRFVRFVQEQIGEYTNLVCLPVRTKNGKYTGREKDEHFENIGTILYKYFRNPMVHEGKDMDARVASRVPIAFFWEDEHIEQGKCMCINGGYLIYLLGCIVRDGVGLKGNKLESELLDNTWSEA